MSAAELSPAELADRRRVLRWEVPVDDVWHEIGGGQVVHVASRQGLAIVEVWTLRDGSGTPFPGTEVRVFGTGHPLPDDVGAHLGTTLAGPLVWHLFGKANA